MSDRPRLRTAVGDTSSLVSLAVPRADPEYDTTAAPDPLQYLLTSCEVSVPPAVVTELEDTAAYSDVHGAAASNVLAAGDHYAVKDPYARSGAPDTRPEVGLDDGETDGIVLANALGVDGFLTDEFGGRNFALVHAALRGPRLVPAPRLVCDYARNGHMSHEAARSVVAAIGARRSWEGNPYVEQLLDGLGDPSDG